MIKILPAKGFELIEYISSDKYDLAKDKISMIMSHPDIYVYENIQLEDYFMRLRRDMSHIIHIQDVPKYVPEINRLIEISA